MKIKPPSLPENLPVVPLEEALMDAGENDSDIRSVCFESDTVEGLDIANLEFNSCVFFACRFRNCELYRCFFVNCRFESCDFSLNSLSESNFVRCHVSGGKFMGAGLDGAFLTNTVFADVNCEYLNFTGAAFKNTRFENCNLGNAGLDNCKFRAIELRECILTGANLANTSLSGVDISTCELGGLTFAGGELRGAIISPFQATELVKLLGVVLAEYNIGEDDYTDDEKPMMPEE